MPGVRKLGMAPGFEKWARSPELGFAQYYSTSYSLGMGVVLNSDVFTPIYFCARGPLGQGERPPETTTHF